MRRALCVLLFALSVASLGASACQRHPAASSEDDAGAPVDVEIMAYLSEARALHHEANLKESAGDLPGAILALDRLTGARRPHEGTRVPEVEEVLADTYARVAELRLRSGDTENAGRAVEVGLAHAPAPTYFRGHLLEVSGVVEETRAAQLLDAGESTASAGARARAIRLLEEAVSVQEKVVHESLGADDAGEGGLR